MNDTNKKKEKILRGSDRVYHKPALWRNGQRIGFLAILGVVIHAHCNLQNTEIHLTH